MPSQRAAGKDDRLFAGGGKLLIVIFDTKYRTISLGHIVGDYAFGGTKNL
jgi:hypothetical protein